VHEGGWWPKLSATSEGEESKLDPTAVLAAALAEKHESGALECLAK